MLWTQHRHEDLKYTQSVRIPCAGVCIYPTPECIDLLQAVFVFAVQPQCKTWMMCGTQMRKRITELLHLPCCTTGL